MVLIFTQKLMSTLIEAGLRILPMMIWKLPLAGTLWKLMISTQTGVGAPEDGLSRHCRDVLAKG